MSARPHVYKNISESNSYGTFRTLIRTGHLHALPTLLPGNLCVGFKAVVQLLCCCRSVKCQRCHSNRIWQKAGEFKYKTFEQYLQLYPEFQFVFCGDDGQGDLYAGELMRRRYPVQVRAVFVHDVEPDKSAVLTMRRVNHEPPISWAEQVQQLDADRVFVRKTYIGAAVCFMSLPPPARGSAELPLLSKHDVAEIGKQACMDFEDLQCRVWKEGWPSLEEAAQQLNNDIRATNKLLFDGEHIPQCLVLQQQQ